MIYRALALPIVLSAAACGYFKHDKKAKDPEDRLERIEAVANIYSSLGSTSEDAAGFVNSRCDSLLFTGLYDATSGRADTVPKAQDPNEPGRWYRNPDHADCDNDISRDMLIGLAWWSWQTGAGAIAKGVVDYAKAHDMQMGQGPVDVVTMSPELLDTFYKISRAFGGADDPDLDKNSAALANNNRLTDVPLPGGFLGHLLVLHELLRAHIYGAASQMQIDIFKQKAKDQPHNGLFLAAMHLYTDGNQEATLAALDDATLFPQDRLPAPGDRCEEYLWQRDENRNAGGDWAPCSGPRPHSGTDLKFALKVAENWFRKGP